MRRAGWVVVAVVMIGAVALVASRRPDRAAPVETPDGAVPTSASPLPAPRPRASPSAPQPDNTLVMWTRGELPPAVADDAEDLPNVTAAAYVRSDTLGLVASWRADGSVVDQFDGGFRVPVAVSAIDPVRYARIKDPGADNDAITSLRPGDVLLSETSAGLRGIGRGGSIELTTGSRLDVTAVVPDGTVGNAEIVVHVTDADAVGMQTDGSVVVRHSARGAAVRALRRALRGLAPEGDPVRVVDGARRISAPLVLSLAEMKRRFGEPAYRPREGVREIDVDPAFVTEHIVSADVPLLGSVRCHAGIIDDLRAALQDVEDAGFGTTIDPAQYAGCYYPRRISTSGEELSHHSWGIALDINVDLSLPGGGPLPDPEVIAIFGRHGFRWGGDFLNPDNHHFEWLGPEAAQRP